MRVLDAVQKVVSLSLAGATALALGGMGFNVYMNTGRNRKPRAVAPEAGGVEVQETAAGTGGTSEAAVGTQ